MSVRTRREGGRVGDRAEVAESGGDGQVVGPAVRLAEIPAATLAWRLPGRPLPVEAKCLRSVVTYAIEPDLRVGDLGARAGLAHAVGKRDSLNVLDVLEQSLEIFADLRPLPASEVAELGPIVRVTHWGSPIRSGIAPNARSPLNCCRGG